MRSLNPPLTKDDFLNSSWQDAIDSSESSDPWVQFAGIFKNDPLFDEFVEAMAAERRKLDAEMPAYDAANEENQPA